MRVFSFRAWHKDEKRMCKVKSFGEKFLLLENCELDYRYRFEEENAHEQI